MKIALLTPCFWPEVARGTERITRELADGLLDHGQQPWLITSHPGLPRRRLEAGLPVVRLPRPPQGPLLRMHFEPYLTQVPLTYLALRTGSFDLVHAMYPADALAAIRWQRRTGRPAVLSYMGIPEPRWLDAARLRRQLLGHVASRCDAVVMLSRHAASVFERGFGRQAEVIYPGVDLVHFVPRAKRHPRPTIICTAAPEVSRKNVGLLIEAFGLIRRRYADARLILVAPRDPAAARRIGLPVAAPGVEWLEPGHRAEVLAEAYSGAWVCALPAADEAFGKVLVESLACGTPVVGFAQGGIPEIIENPRVGRMFDRLEPVPLAQALTETLELAGDPSTARACREHAERFSSERATEDYLELYRRLAGS